jgi:ribosomal protein S4
MRLRARYQIYLKAKGLIDNFPKRLWFLKRPKWKTFCLFKKFKRRYKFINYFSPAISKNKYKFIKMELYYGNCLLSKTKLLQFYDFSYNLKKAKKDILFLKNFKYKNLFKYLIFKQVYRLDVILWRLNIYSSTFEARQAIQKKFVLVNNKKSSIHYLIKNGDIIKLLDNKYSFKIRQILNTFKLYPKYYSFLEFDAYTGAFIVIKNFQECILDDISVTLPRYINFNAFFNFLNKK